MRLRLQHLLFILLAILGDLGFLTKNEFQYRPNRNDYNCYFLFSDTI